MNVPPDRLENRGSGARRFLWITLLLLAALAVLYGLFVWYYNYSSGERAGWVQKFSKKGWLCKTWEGELALVTMPGTAQEKFYFTVLDDEVAAEINKAMGKRVALHYVEKVGIPTTCFGETRHYVVGIKAVQDIPLAPGIIVPNAPLPAPAAPPAAPGPTSAPAPAPTPSAPAPSAATPSPAIEPAAPPSAPATPAPSPTPGSSPAPSPAPAGDAPK